MNAREILTYSLIKVRLFVAPHICICADSSVSEHVHGERLVGPAIRRVPTENVALKLVPVAFIAVL